MKTPKRGITWRGKKFSIDVLQCEKEIAAGTFSEEDRATLDRILPGVVQMLERKAAERAAGEL